MTRLKVKVTDVRKLQKWPISQSVSSVDVYVMKRLMVNCDTLRRQYLNFNWTDF